MILITIKRKNIFQVRIRYFLTLTESLREDIITLTETEKGVIGAEE